MNQEPRTQNPERRTKNQEQKPMAFTPFIQRCRKTAHRETASIGVQQLLLPWGMPRKTYVLHEFYCDDLSCDCRVARLVVLLGELGNGLETDAVLTVGWEPVAFYCREGLPFPALHGSMLAPDQPQGPWAWALAAIVGVIYADPDRLVELAAHYKEFRSTLLKEKN